MSASLVGSEMCIRDSSCPPDSGLATAWTGVARPKWPSSPGPRPASPRGCLLYTSDAADDM
eukprot:3199043-Alexandrium_andersonii.AAC.1